MTVPLPKAFDFLRHGRLVWIQAIGRLLYLAGYTAIQFYTPILFVNQMGLSATTVGIALGSGSLAGVAGHLLGGYLADAPAYGRKRALLFAAILAIVAAILLAIAPAFPVLIGANLLLGLSAGCYWTAADAAVVDATVPDQRQTAFALLVLADSIGSGIGVWGGTLVHDRLFGFSTVPLALFLLLMLFAITEQQEFYSDADPLTGFGVALRDRSLLLFVLVNVLFTTYTALVSSTLPLYLTRLNGTADPATDGAIGSVAQLFTWSYIGLGAVLQIPIIQLLKGWNKARALMLSMGLWSLGFGLVWLTASVSMSLLVTVAALSVLSIAGVIYKPFAPAIVAEFAPTSLLGVYLAISYQCWSFGYFVGPIVGGWIMDQPSAQQIWLWAAGTTMLGLIGLQRLAGRSEGGYAKRSGQVAEAALQQGRSGVPPIEQE